MFDSWITFCWKADGKSCGWWSLTSIQCCMDTQLIPASLCACIMKLWEIELLVQRERWAVWKTAFIPGRLLLMTAPVWLWVVVEEVEWRGRLNLQAPPVTMGLGSNLSASISISLTLLQGWKVLWELDRHLPRGHAWMAKGHMAQSSSKFVIRKQHPKVIKGNHCRHVHVDQRKSKPGMMAHVYKPSTRETEAEGLRVGDQLRQ